jgi:integrase
MLGGDGSRPARTALSRGGAGVSFVQLNPLAALRSGVAPGPQRAAQQGEAMHVSRIHRRPWVLLQGGKHLYRDAAGKRVTKTTPGAVRIDLGLTDDYYGRLSGRLVKLCPNKTASEQLLAKMSVDALRQAHGLGDPFAKHRAVPLVTHVSDWEAALAAGGAGKRHVAGSVACVRRVLAGCDFKLTADLAASKVEVFLGQLREDRGQPDAIDPPRETYTQSQVAKIIGVKKRSVASLLRRHRLDATGNGKARRYPRATVEALLTIRRRGVSGQTSNGYLAAMKQFCAWLVADRRLAENPLTHLEPIEERSDRRHDRRPLSADELRALLATARSSSRVFRNLCGSDREMLYVSAVYTGFRAGELAALTPAAFRLDDGQPRIELGAAFTKNKRTAVQLLPADVAVSLRAYLAGRDLWQPVWAGGWADNAADMLRVDLQAAGIAYAKEGPDGPLYADFHALRHSYVALLDRSGATLKEAMQLARHSDPKLTMAVYGRAQLHDLAEAINRLPTLLSPTTGAERLRATGTDGRAANDGMTGAPLRAPVGFVDEMAFPQVASGNADPATAATPDDEAEKTTDAVGNRKLLATQVFTRPLADRCGRVTTPDGANEQAPRVGFEPTTNRLTAGCSTVELSGKR